MGAISNLRLPTAESAAIAEPTFYYFAYGSCMCPVDLKRSLGEDMHHYVIGAAQLKGYRLGFFSRSRFRDSGVLDIVKDANSTVEGVLYQLPWRFSDPLDLRELGYHHEMITVHRGNGSYTNVRTYTVTNKLPEEHAPNDWYFKLSCVARSPAAYQSNIAGNCLSICTAFSSKPGNVPHEGCRVSAANRSL